MSNSLGTPVSDVFGQAAPAALPAVQDAPKTGLGTSISDVFGTAKPAVPPKSPLSGLLAEVKAAGKPAMAKLKGLGQSVAQSLNPANNQIMRKYTSDALDQLKKDWKEPAQAGDMLQGPKVALDVLSTLWAPVQASIDEDIAGPMKQSLGKLADLTSKWQEWTPAQRREMWESGQGKKDSNEAGEAIRNLEGLVDPALNALQILGPGPKALKLLGVERDSAALRTASEALHSSATPAEQKSVSLALDKSMGFKGVKENLAETLNKLPLGTSVNAKLLIGQMLPHSQGYAKKFLQTLFDHIDESVKIKFSDHAGWDVQSLGVYTPSTHEIQIKMGQPEIIHSLSHEMYHATTVNMIDTLMETELKAAEAAKGSKLTDGEVIKLSHKPKNALIRELDGVIAETRLRWSRAGLGSAVWEKVGYGIQPEHTPMDMEYHKLSGWEKAWQPQIKRYEFLAEMFSNPHLQEFMANSEKYASPGYKFKNMLQQFGVMIGKHLGLTRPHDLQLLNQALSVGSRIMRMQGAGEATKGQDFRDIVVAHTQEGGTITRGEMEAATGLHPQVQSIEVSRRGAKQSLSEARSALQLTIEGILRTVAPEALGKNAKLAASVVASRITEQMQKTAAWRYGSKTRFNFWRARPDLTKEFITKFEKGEVFKDPELAKLSRKYRAWLDSTYAQDKANGIQYDPRENYLPHLFTDQEGVSEFFNRRYGGKWGDPGFIKDRSFDLYDQAIAAGFTPKFDTPEDIILARQQASDLAEMNIGILNDLASYGLATLKVKGGTKLIKDIDAEGKASLRFEETEGNKQPGNTTRWRAPNGDVFWVDNQAAVVLENAFRSKSLWSDKTLVGTGFRGFMRAKNLIVPVRLSLSLFHPMHIVGIDIAATMTRQLSGMLSGKVNPVVGFAKMLKSGIDPFYSNPKVGWRVLKALRGQISKDALNASDTEALQHLVDGGLILDMSPQYRTNARQNFVNAWLDAHGSFRMRKPGALAWDVTRATWHAPWALLSAAQKPIFEEWIPMLKGASYLQDVQTLLERNPELVEDRAARQLALRKLAKSAENRYGEMAYNTLFWKRWFKDIAVLNTLSLGWQMGFLREYGGGAMDLGQFARSSDKLQRVRQGLLDRPLFVANYTALGAGMAGLMTYGFTGKPPTSLLDYIDPQIGGQNPDGTPKRVSTMFYSREFVSLYKHVQNQGMISGVTDLVSNKGSGLFGLMHEWYSGLNDFGEEIRDPNSDAFKQTEETLAYTLADMEPISVSTVHQQAQTQTQDKVLAAMGFTPAPKYITETKSEAMISDAFDKYVRPQETSFDRAEYSGQFRKLRKQYLSGDPRYGDTLDSMIEKYQLSNKDIRRVIKSLNMDLSPSIKMFIQLPWQEQKALLDKMPEEERDMYLPHANKEHLRNSYQAPQ